MVHCISWTDPLCGDYLVSGPFTHLETLSDELGHLTVLRVLLPTDDEVDETLGVPQHGGRVGLGHSHQAGAVNLETGNCQVGEESGGASDEIWVI